MYIIHALYCYTQELEDRMAQERTICAPHDHIYIRFCCRRADASIYVHAHTCLLMCILHCFKLSQYLQELEDKKAQEKRRAEAEVFAALDRLAAERSEAKSKC
jgi:hypothetical protein